MASYDVKYAEVQELFNEFNLFNEQLEEAIERVDKRITGLVELESFKGAAASSIKRYFADHKKILARIQMLTEQLSHEYAAAYYNEFLAYPIEETHDDARWPRATLKKAQSKMLSIRTTSLASADSEIAKAKAEAPVGIGFSYPNIDSIVAEMERQEKKTGRVMEGIERIENDGKRAFANQESGFSQLASSLGTLISQYSSGNIDMTSYSSGTFESLEASTGVAAAVETCTSYQQATEDITLSAKRDSIKKEEIRLQREWEEESKKKENASWWGVGLSAALLIVGVAAVALTSYVSVPVGVAIFGASSSSLGLIGGMFETKSRVDNIIDQRNGDVRADRDTTMEDATSDVKDFADLGEAVNSYSEKPWKIKEFALDKSLDSAYSEVSEEDQYRSKIAREGASGMRDILTDAASGSITMSGPETILKVYSVKYDYEVSKADTKLDEIYDRQQRVSKLVDYYQEDSLITGDDPNAW